MSSASFTAIIDTREQLPLVLKTREGGDIPSRVEKLDTADYSVVGLEKIVAIERKSLDDLLACVGRDRARFEREMQRLLAFETKLIVVESSWSAIKSGKYRSKVHPSSVIGSLYSWMSRGIPILMAGSHADAGIAVSRLLEITVNRKRRELAAFVKEISA